MRLLTRTLLLAGALLVGLAAPAAADPAEPSDFRSQVTAVEPTTDGIAAEVLGADSFLQLQVEAGRTVVVIGYDDEPYLRFQPDGTVERNTRSPATYLNDDRFGAIDLPPDADPGADPAWEQVAEGGTYAWHDHRTHWMGSGSPVGRGERVGGAFDPWVVPLVVDGSPVEVRGTLDYVEVPSPLPWLGTAVVAAAALAVVGRAAPLRSAAGALTLASALAVVLGRAEFAVSPADAGANPLLWALPVVALVTGAAATLLGERSASVVLALGSVAALAGWAVLRLDAILKPVLPTPLPDALDRGGVALAFGVAAAAAYLAVTSGALALPALDDEPDEERRATERVDDNGASATSEDR